MLHSLISLKSMEAVRPEDEEEEEEEEEEEPSEKIIGCGPTILGPALKASSLVDFPRTVTELILILY